MDPTGQFDALADIGGAQFGTIVGAVGVHVQNQLFSERDWRERFTGRAGFVKGRPLSSIA
jgi:hypothetical protein